MTPERLAEIDRELDGFGAIAASEIERLTDLARVDAVLALLVDGAVSAAEPSGLVEVPEEALRAARLPAVLSLDGHAPADAPAPAASALEALVLADVSEMVAPAHAADPDEVDLVGELGASVDSEGSQPLVVGDLTAALEGSEPLALAELSKTRDEVLGDELFGGLEGTTELGTGDLEASIEEVLAQPAESTDLAGLLEGEPEVAVPPAGAPEAADDDSDEFSERTVAFAQVDLSQGDAASQQLAALLGEDEEIIIEADFEEVGDDEISEPPPQPRTGAPPPPMPSPASAPEAPKKGLLGKLFGK